MVNETSRKPGMKTILHQTYAIVLVSLHVPDTRRRPNAHENTPECRVLSNTE